MTQTMNEQTPERSRNEIEAHLVAQAWKDETFKQKLLANPKVVIEREFGVQLPETLSVRVMAEDANTLYITLPDQPNLNEEELSEDELEAVAGGVTPLLGVGLTATAFGIGATSKEVADQGGW
ncbi:NHLP leader peptide family RiPP precursor [Hyella patelloides]|nr:NHLP leader peptide family RiPP precursor [Hyella patelloides]